MAIFPHLELEASVQTDDRTRLSAIKSYASKDGPAIVKVEIQPEASEAFVEVTGTKAADWFTDWQYTSGGVKVVVVKINGATTPVLFTSSLTVITEVDDALFAEDSDLTQEEPDILKYVKPGRNSFKDVHREVQRLIIDEFDRKGYIFSDGTKVTKAAVTDVSEVRQWAKYWALAMIYNGNSNILDDINAQKSKYYMSKALEVVDRTITRLDLNKDGTADIQEGVKFSTSLLSRR